MLERYLKDSIPADRLKEVDRIANANLMPSYVKYLQYIEDSARAFNWAERYKDSSQIKRFYRTNPVRPTLPVHRSRKTQDNLCNYLIPDCSTNPSTHNGYEPTEILQYRKA